MDNSLKLCLFSSSPDIARHSFLVKVLTGSPEELAQKTKVWGYDGIELLPNPELIPDPDAYKSALDNEGVKLYVVNSGRIAAQGLALLHQDDAIRDKSVRCFQDLIEFASHFGARVGLGVARGAGIPGATPEEMDQLAEEVFRTLAACAERHGVVVMLEAAEAEVTSFINTMEEVMQWVDRLGSPGFSAMLDTHQLIGAEKTVEQGVRATRGEATHIHLYDPSRWPPGVLEEKDRLDWGALVQTLRSVHMPQTGSVVLAPSGDPGPAAIKSRRYLQSLLGINVTDYKDASTVAAS